MTTTANKRLEAALEYATAMGWSDFPVPPNTKKSYKSAEYSGGRKWGATRDVEEIKRDWERWPDANVGVPCGKANGMWVVETDTRAGGHAHDGEESLAELVARHGSLPDTLKARSPSGSIHYYFKWPDDCDVNGEIKNTAGKVGPGIDTRGEGGMVVAPPSRRKDGEYKWLNWGSAIAPAPAWLIELARAASKKARTESRRREDGAAHCDVKKLEAALKLLPNPLPDDLESDPEMGLRGGWESWNKVLMSIYAGDRTSIGQKLAKDWSRKHPDYPDDDAAVEDRWRRFDSCPPTDIGPDWLYKLVRKINPGWDQISFEDFYSYLPSRTYLFLPTMQHWSKDSVNACLPPDEMTVPKLNKQGDIRRDANGEVMTKVVYVKAHVRLDKERAVHHRTWLPDKPTIVEDRILTNEGVWVDRRGARTYNLYRPPTLIPGDGRLAGPFLDLVDKVVGDNRPHVLAWFAHRVQRPGEMINHALLIGGAPGIGKDSMIEPLRRAVGPHNFAEVDPTRMIGRFNGFLQAVVLRINEARDLGEVSRYHFYDKLKEYTASPPDTLVIEEKFLPTYPIAKVVGFIITTNYKDGLYLPVDDRRAHVSWSDAKVDDNDEDFFTSYWTWLNSGGDGHVAAFLRDYDLSKFNPKAPPPKTEAFYEMVEAGIHAEAHQIENVIEVEMRSPVALTIQGFKNSIPLPSDLRVWAEKNDKLLPRRIVEAGYAPVRNPDDKSRGRWRIDGARMPIYVKSNLTRDEQVAAVRKFIKKAEKMIANKKAGLPPETGLNDDEASSSSR